MFKTFLNSKFKFSNELFSNLGNNFGGNFNSASIGNLLINYPNYAKIQNENSQAKIKQDNEKSKRNYLSVTNTEKQVVKNSNWRLSENKENNTSELLTEFTFNDESIALDFISLVKDKCDEIDHHPSWTYKANHKTRTFTLKINLTSHFAKNNVTEKDYELAAYLTSEYHKLNQFYFDQKFRMLMSTTATIVFFFIFYSYTMKKYKNAKYHFTMLDTTVS